MWIKKGVFNEKYMGLFFVIISVALFLVFKLYIVKLAYTKMPNGEYSEVYELVSSFKNYVYAIIVILFIGGVVYLVKPSQKKKASIDSPDKKMEKE